MASRERLPTKEKAPGTNPQTVSAVMACSPFTKKPSREALGIPRIPARACARARVTKR